MRLACAGLRMTHERVLRGAVTGRMLYIVSENDACAGGAVRSKLDAPQEWGSVLIIIFI